MVKKTKKIKWMCTAFRDGFQSVFGARVLSKDYMPIVKQVVDSGVTNIEAGGGASFQASFFYNNENAFDVMDKFRAVCGPAVNLQTLARGVNVVALDSQSSDMIKLHAELFKKHGITTIRNFDALNDPQNLIYSAHCIEAAGLKHQLCVAMMSLPPGCFGAHTADFYEKTLKKFIKSGMPFDSLCFKDASGTSVPSVVYETVRRARKLVGSKVPIEFHSHETAGVGLACYLAAVEGGADIVDLSMAPVSGGTCQPDVATMWHALRGSDFELECDIDALMRVEENFKDMMKEYFIPPEALHVEPKIPWSPMPGGALTANTQMLRDNHLMDRYAEIIKAMEDVVRKGGFGTSVTPVSQFYFQQAFNNVMYGPWKKIADGYGKMVLGYFGKTPVAPNAEVVKIATEQLGLAPTTKSVLSINDQEPQKSRAHYVKMLQDAGLSVTDENIFIAASCKDKGIAFLEGKGKIGVRYVTKEKKCSKSSETVSVDKMGEYKIQVENEIFNVHLKGNMATVNGKDYQINIDSTDAVSNGQKETEKTNVPEQNTVRKSLIIAGTPGVVTKIFVQENTVVKSGQDICIIEVMKMETVVKSTINGKISCVFVQIGNQVETGQKLFEVIS